MTISECLHPSIWPVNFVLEADNVAATITPQHLLFNGPDFYRLPRNTEQITLVKSTWRIPDEVPLIESEIVPLWAGHEIVWQIQ